VDIKEWIFLDVLVHFFFFSHLMISFPKISFQKPIVNYYIATGGQHGLMQYFILSTKYAVSLISFQIMKLCVNKLKHIF